MEYDTSMTGADGPSGFDIRREYVAPIAKAVAGTEVIPYVIPGRCRFS